MGNEFEAESLARAGEGVEILDKDIHLGDVAHRGSFTTEQINDGVRVLRCAASRRRCPNGIDCLGSGER